MPAAYTHDRFGTDLMKILPADIRKTVTRFPQLFRVGLQGPDILFYYQPAFKTSIGALGPAAHRQTGTEFFTRSAKAADTEAGQAYLWGLLAHYALDALCHAYIDRQTQENGLNHLQLEAEFDRYLLALDGVSSPETYDRGTRLKLTRGECVTAAGFFPPAKPGHINESVKSTALCMWFFSRPKGLLRSVTMRVLKALGTSQIYLVVPSRAEPKFRQTNEQMLALYQQALDLYTVLLAQLENHIKTGAPLGPEFEPVFG